MFKDKGAQDHYAGALFSRLPIGIEITHSSYVSCAVAIDAKNFGSGFEIEVAGFKRHWDRDIKCRRLRVDMAAIKIAVTAVDTSRAFRNARIERLGRAIGLGENSGRGVVRMVTEFLAGFSE